MGQVIVIEAIPDAQFRSPRYTRMVPSLRFTRRERPDVLAHRRVVTVTSDHLTTGAAAGRAIGVRQVPARGCG
jgi:hypothetical protein